MATENVNVVTETPVTAQPQTALFVGDIDVGVTEEELRRLFDEIGEVASVKICTDPDFEKSLGYGYVNYTNPDHAAKAIDELNSTPLKGKRIRISYSILDATVRKNGAGNLYVKNLDKEIDHKALRKIFSPFGNIISAKVETEPSGTSKGYGYVHYDTDKAASDAIELLNGVEIKGKNIFVARFISKEERGNSTNLFVKNLSESTTEEDLKTIFQVFGSITSVAVMKDEKGCSKCFGFVAFSKKEEASKAILEMKGKMVDGKPLYVAVAERKETRQARLQAIFANARPVVNPPVVPNIYRPNGAGQLQVYRSDHQPPMPPIFHPAVARFGYQPQLGITPHGSAPIFRPPPVAQYNIYQQLQPQRMARPLFPPGYGYPNIPQHQQQFIDQMASLSLN